MTITFEKMHGLGNDFVIIDERQRPMQIVEAAQRADAVRVLASRKTGIGCDQLIVMRASGRADVYIEIFNADGSLVEACGNATRCVAWLLMRETRTDTALIDSEGGLLECRLQEKGSVTVNMGGPRLAWQDIPMAHEADTLNVPLKRESLRDPVAVNIGNPHLVFFEEDIGKIPLKVIGPKLEHDPLFPEKINVTIARIDDLKHITMRTWERGAGATLACGTAACATMVAARRRGYVDEKVTMQLPGGDLVIAWDGNEKDPHHSVWMTGPVAHAFSGTLREAEWI